MRAISKFIMSSTIYPMKLKTTKWRMTWAKMKSASARSCVMNPNCDLFSGLTCMRKQAEKRQGRKVSQSIHAWNKNIGSINQSMNSNYPPSNQSINQSIVPLHSYGNLRQNASIFRTHLLPRTKHATVDMNPLRKELKGKVPTKTQ